MFTACFFPPLRRLITTSRNANCESAPELGPLPTSPFHVFLTFCTFAPFPQLLIFTYAYKHLCVVKLQIYIIAYLHKFSYLQFCTFAYLHVYIFGKFHICTCACLQLRMFSFLQNFTASLLHIYIHG